MRTSVSIPRSPTSTTFESPKRARSFSICPPSPPWSGRRLSEDMEERFGHPVLLAETFVDPSRFRGS